MDDQIDTSKMTNAERTEYERIRRDAGRDLWGLWFSIRAALPELPAALRAAPPELKVSLWMCVIALTALLIGVMWDTPNPADDPAGLIWWEGYQLATVVVGVVVPIIAAFLTVYGIYRVTTRRLLIRDYLRTIGYSRRLGDDDDRSQ